MVIGDWQVSGPPGLRLHAIRSVADSQISTAWGKLIPLVQQRNVTSPDFFYLPLAKGRGRGVERIIPAATGILKSTKDERRPTLAGRTKITFDGTVNVTTFVQGQRILVAPRSRRIVHARASALAVRPDENWWENEPPLNMDPNLIIGSNSRYRYALSRPAEMHCAALIDAVEKTVGDPLNAAIDCNGGSVSRTRRYVLRGLEVYWEFTHDNPIALVDILIPCLRTLTERNRTTRRLIYREVIELTEQSQCITIYLRADTRLRVYPKTGRRVRFEVIFDDDAVSRIVRRRETDQKSEFIDWLHRLKEVAATELNWVFAQLRRPSLPDLHGPTADGLRNAILAASPDLYTACIVLEALQRFGRVAPASNPAVLQTVRNLRRHGVLTPVRHRRSVYVVTRAFRLM